MVLQNILRRTDVERLTGLPRSTIYDRMARGEFPKPIKLSAKSVGWLESEVAAWQQARIDAREANSPGAPPGSANRNTQPIRPASETRTSKLVGA
jgi:prophage regulatory protein